MKSFLIRTADLVELGVGRRTITRNVSKGKWHWQWGYPQGATGQKEKQILVSDLPPDLQLKWQALQEKRASAVAETEPRSSSNTPPDERLQKLSAALARFSPPKYTLEDRQAVERHAVAMTRLYDEIAVVVVRLKKSRQLTVACAGTGDAGFNRTYHPELKALASRAVSSDPVYLQLYESANEEPSVSTVLRRLKEYQREGAVVFVRAGQSAQRANDDRRQDVPEIALDWLRANLKNYVKASVTLYGERWLAWARQHGVALPFSDHRPGKEGSCYSWLYRWRQRVPAVALTLARDGEKGLEIQYEYIIRDTDNLRPRDAWVMDWRILDVECFVEVGKLGGKPILTRRWFCPVFDLASNAVVGWHWSDRPSARGVTLAYLNAIGEAEWKDEPAFALLRGMQRQREGGIKPFVYWDNGKDYRAESVEGHEITISHFDIESGLEATLKSYLIGLAAEVGIEVRHAKPFNAKAKPVEPFFRYGIGLWEETMPGFKGNKPGNNPHFYKAARAIHETEFIKGKPAKTSDIRQLPPLWREVYEKNRTEFGVGTPFLSESALKAEFTKAVIDYLRRPSDALANARGAQSPIEFWNATADTPVMLTQTTMAALLMEPRVLTVRQGQLTVKWSGEAFVYREVASELSDGTALYRLPESSKVEFRYDPNNVGRAMVMNGGAAICWVEQPVLLGYNANSADFKAANDRKKNVRRVANEYFNTGLDRPDWRDEAEARQNVVPLRAVANGLPEEEIVQSPPITGAEITALTRFDRRAASSGRLSIVGNEAAQPPDEEWSDVFETPVEPSTGDGWNELWE